jgi:hypothetical protein
MHLVVSTFTVTVAMTEASWVMPVNTKSLLNAESNAQKDDTGWKSAQQHLSYKRTVSWHVLGESPGFISKRESGR